MHAANQPETWVLRTASPDRQIEKDRKERVHIFRMPRQAPGKTRAHRASTPHGFPSSPERQFWRRAHSSSLLVFSLSFGLCERAVFTETRIRRRRVVAGTEHCPA